MRIICYVGIFLLFGLYSCGENLGNRVEGTHFCIYFQDKTDLKLVKKIGQFWKKNALIGSRKQSLKLSKSGNSYLLHLIANEPENLDKMPFEHQKLLIDLQQELTQLVGKNEKIELVLCNSKFEEKKRISI